MLKKYSARGTEEKQRPTNLTSRKKSSMHELAPSAKMEEDSPVLKRNKDRRFLNKQDVDLLFPSQLKSYYASSEF